MHEPSGSVGETGVRRANVHPRCPIADWLWAMRDHPGPKLVTGRRGIGKSAQLASFADRLVAEGVPKSGIVSIDGESAQACRLLSSDRIIDYIDGQCRGAGNVYVLIREGSSFPDIETVLGTLAAMPRFNVFATASSRSMLTAGLGRYLDGRLAHYECLPPLHAESPEEMRRIWHEALLYDVRTPIRQSFNAQVLNCLACHLSDNVGDSLSLRRIASAISPAGGLLSPHTIDSYLTAFCNAYLVEKCLRYDLAEECVQKSQFRCYFTSPAMRSALFNSAPSGESRRARLNAAWLRLRSESDEVFAASSAPEQVDFVTRTGTDYRMWHVGEREISEVPRDSFVAG